MSCCCCCSRGSGSLWAKFGFFPRGRRSCEPLHIASTYTTPALVRACARTCCMLYVCSPLGWGWASSPRLSPLPSSFLDEFEWLGGVGCHSFETHRHMSSACGRVRRTWGLLGWNIPEAWAWAWAALYRVAHIGPGLCVSLSLSSPPRLLSPVGFVGRGEPEEDPWLSHCCIGDTIQICGRIIAAYMTCWFAGSLHCRGM